MGCTSNLQTRHARSLGFGSRRAFDAASRRPFHSCACQFAKWSKRSPRKALLTKAGKDDQQSDDESLERLLWKELEKRGISGPEQLGKQSKTRESSRQRPDPPPQFEEDKIRSQLEESRKLNSEGLEGLIPRARQLASLGGTFFLAFWPFLLAITALFSGIFWLYGEDFIHGGRPSYTKYVEPAELLSEPTVDERIPFK